MGMNQLCWPFCLPLVSDSCSQRLSFFSQKILVILMPSSDWGLELNVSLSTTSFFFSIFFYHLFFFISLCLPAFLFILCLFLLSLRYCFYSISSFFFHKYNIFYPFSGHDVLSLPAQNYFPFFHVKHTVQSLENYHAIIPWRDFQLNCSDFFQKNNESGAQARPMSCFLLKWSGANAETHRGFILLTAP